MATTELERAGIVGNVLPLDVTVRMDPSGAAKVTEIVNAVLGSDVPHVAVRAALLAGDTTPLDLAAHRRPPKSELTAALADGA